jgi:iron(III) transport system substrate-binding protein
MVGSRLSRRYVLKGSGAIAATMFASPLRAQAPAPEAVTPALLEAAKKEGKLVFYTAMDLQLAERLGRTFEQKYPGIAVRVERSGAERVFQRIDQEYRSNIRAVDVVNTADQAHCIIWKRNGWLQPYLPEEVAKNFDKRFYDPDALHVTTRVLVSPFGYNTKLVKAEDAPKSFADLLDPKWAGKMVKAHPGYSGTIMTATQQMSRDLGWEYFERLAKQRVMQVQSASDPPKKLDLGERAVMADGNEYNLLQLKEAGKPVEVVYPTEGVPLVVGPNGIFKRAPNPNAARLFQLFCFTPECQQLIIEVGGMRSMHPQAKEKPGRKPFAEIKTLKEDAAAVEKEGEAIKARYSKLFGV